MRRIPPLIALIGGIIFWCLSPEGWSWWRLALGLIFSITLGHQIGVLIAGWKRPANHWMIGLASAVSLVCFLGAVFQLPGKSGWVLLVAGYVLPWLMRTTLSPSQRNHGGPG